MTHHKDQSPNRDQTHEASAEIRRGTASMLQGMALTLQGAASLLEKKDPLRSVTGGPSTEPKDNPPGGRYATDDLDSSIRGLETIKDLVDEVLRELLRAREAQLDVSTVPRD